MAKIYTTLWDRRKEKAVNWLIFLGISVILLISIITNVGKISRGNQMRRRLRDESRSSGESAPRKPSQVSRKDEEHMINEMYGREEEPRKSLKRNVPVGTTDPKGRRWKVIIANRDTYEEYEFIFRNSIGIGRIDNEEDFECFLIVNDPKVSKLHCAIVCAKDSLFVQDEGSSNSTFLNKKRIDKPQEIHKEDIIKIGNSTLEIIRVFRESR